MSLTCCFIFPGNVFSTPYLQRYLDLFEGTYDFISWNAACIDENTNARKHYRLNYRFTPSDSKIHKLLGYAKFKWFATNILRRNDYDHVVCLTGNAAVLLSRILITKYRKRYIVDIRDYYKEHITLYRKAQECVLASCGLSVISSLAFKSFLPTRDYVLVNNITRFKPEEIEYMRNRTHENLPIVLSCIGNNRFLEQNKRIITAFANDTRFELRFIGAGSDNLAAFCQDNGFTNVKLIDRFPPQDTAKFYMDSDMILSLYGNDSPSLKYALSNKIYYAAQAGIPILVCSGTYMETVSQKYGIGFTVDLENKQCADRLFVEYMDIKWPQLRERYDHFLVNVAKEDVMFDLRVAEFLNGGVTTQCEV